MTVPNKSLLTTLVAVLAIPAGWVAGWVGEAVQLDDLRVAPQETADCVLDLPQHRPSAYPELRVDLPPPPSGASGRIA